MEKPPSSRRRARAWVRLPAEGKGMRSSAPLAALASAPGFAGTPALCCEDGEGTEGGGGAQDCADILRVADLV